MTVTDLIERLKQELGWPTETERRLADADANAPWLTQAHMICTDHGIPQGNISDRLEMLVGYLAEAERERDERTEAFNIVFDRCKSIANERDSLQKRVTECESVILHYGMETEHSCMCQFANDTDAPTSECGYHEKIRAERDEAQTSLQEALALLREIKTSASPIYAKWSRYEVGGYVKDYKVAPHVVHRIDAFLAKHKEGGE